MDSSLKSLTQCRFIPKFQTSVRAKSLEELVPPSKVHSSTSTDFVDADSPILRSSKSILCYLVWK
ncbi:unnamed protein product [Trifolium pratense]|uniref:Uncharacterized protein n=1 Tax=Trifolium pratense TaxID=57577 RepID=A0ACB0I6W7_TRIPR|nr:unnamed protein product [Trifolium pratense]